MILCSSKYDITSVWADVKYGMQVPYNESHFIIRAPLHLIQSAMSN